jgi:hypothetical protein
MPRCTGELALELCLWRRHDRRRRCVDAYTHAERRTQRVVMVVVGAGQLRKARLAVAIGGQFEDMEEGQGGGARPFGPV